MHAALLETQRRFLAALYDDSAPGPADQIAGNGLEPAARMRIYRHSCEAIQGDALHTSYPAVLALVGEAFFEQTVRGYRVACRSHSGNLQSFGSNFAEYLEGVPSLLALAYLPDVARLEWLRQRAALAGESADCPSAPVASNFDPARADLVVKLHPSARLLASRHAVLSIWRYAMHPTAARLALPAAGERVIVWREDGQVTIAALDPASFACIASLARGDTLATAAGAGRGEDFKFDFPACIESLVRRGLVVARGEPPLQEAP